jgi:hypothetical protein
VNPPAQLSSRIGNTLSKQCNRVKVSVFCAVAGFCLTSLAAYGTVSQIALQSPQLSTQRTINVTSPIHFQASAESDQNITGYVVYVDGKNVFQNVRPALDAWVLLQPGTIHTIYITAWDASGARLTTPTYKMNIAGVASPPPTMPPSATVRLLDVNQMPPVPWTVDNNNNVGGECNSGTIVPFDNQSDPNTANSPDSALPGQHFLLSSKCQYDDSLFVWKDRAVPQPSDTNFLWDFWVYVPMSTKSTSIQALEFDLFQAVQLSDGVHEFMFGSQCNYATNQWQLWVPQNGIITWVNVGLSPCQLSSGAWHHLTYFLQRVTGSGYQYIPDQFSAANDPNSYLRFGTLTVDGTSMYLGALSRSSIPKPSWAPVLGIQHQLDSATSGVTLEEYSDKEVLMAW